MTGGFLRRGEDTQRQRRIGKRAWGGRDRDWREAGRRQEWPATTKT